LEAALKHQVLICPGSGLVLTNINHQNLVTTEKKTMKTSILAL
jgi:hypothetical protein